MNLWEIQSTVAGLLAASANLTGITVISDDGTFPKTPERETALATGLAITIFKPGEPVIISASYNGVTKMSVILRVLAEENVAINRAIASHKVAEKVAQYIMEAVVGQPKGGAPVNTFRAHTPPFDLLGTQNGILRVLVNFEVPIIVRPA